jgi:hypothetical protein
MMKKVLRVSRRELGRGSLSRELCQVCVTEAGNRDKLEKEKLCLKTEHPSNKAGEVATAAEHAETEQDGAMTNGDQGRLNMDAVLTELTESVTELNKSVTELDEAVPGRVNR